MKQDLAVDVSCRRVRARADHIGIALMGIVNLLLLSFLMLNTSHFQGSVQATKSFERVFGQNSALEDLSPAADEAWNNLTFGNDGFLWVKSNDVNTNEAKAGVEEWGVSMFHGLHCLQMIRTALSSATKPTFNTAHGPDDHEESFAHHSKHLDPDHLSHCLGYLVDTLICKGDSTLEPPFRAKLKSGKVHTGVDGKNYLHKCTDITTMSKVVKDSQISRPLKPWDWWPGQTVEDLN